jgi:hypothetical protein
VNVGSKEVQMAAWSPHVIKPFYLEMNKIMSQSHASLVVGEAQLLQFSLYLVHLEDSVDHLSLCVCVLPLPHGILESTYTTPMIRFVCQCVCNYKIDDGTPEKKRKEKGLVTPLSILPNW